MHPVSVILRALARAARRQLGTFHSLKVNNIFLFLTLLVYSALQSGVEPKSSEFLILLFGVLLLFPLSNDPLSLIPSSRLALWPLTRTQRVALRCGSLLASPVLWLAFVVLIFTARPRVLALFLTLAAFVQLVKLGAGRIPRVNLLRYIPQFPSRLGGLIRNDLREMLSTLDPWFAALLALGGTLYRLFGGATLDPRALPVLSLVVGIGLSTYAQCLFGLDYTGSALTRYRLLPLPGWQILLAKDIAFLVVLTALTLPLSPVTGWTFGLTALAIGHWPSVQMRNPIQRWRFTGSRLFPGVVQAIASLVVAFGGYWPVAVLLYAMSLWLAGRAVLKA